MYNIYLYTIYLCRYASKNYTCCMGESPTDLRMFNVKITFRGGRVTHMMLMFRNICTNQLFVENCDITKEEGGFSLTLK